MRIVDVPKKKQQSWQMIRIRHADGTTEILPNVWSNHLAEEVARYRAGGKQAEAIGNVIFEASLRIEKDRLVDAEGGYKYQARDWALYDLLAAVADGRLTAKDGQLCGRFTFRNNGGFVSVVAAPGLGPAPARLEEAPADAPDLSDLVAALGPAKSR